MAWDFRCRNFGNPNVFSQFTITNILGVRISDPNVFSQFSITYILGVRISETQIFSTKISIFCDTLAIIYCQDFGCPNFGNPNLRPNPLVMLCCYYHIPHKMRQTIEIKISSTVSRNFGRIVRKSKKFHTNYPNIVKTCRN